MSIAILVTQLIILFSSLMKMWLAPTNHITNSSTGYDGPDQSYVSSWSGCDLHTFFDKEGYSRMIVIYSK